MAELVWVTNLPKSFGREGLGRFLRPYHSALGIRLMNSGRTAISAYVELGDPAEARSVVQALDGALVGAHRLHAALVLSSRPLTSRGRIEADRSRRVPQRGRNEDTTAA